MRIQSHRIEPVTKGASYDGEKNDCAVRALANAKDIPYEEAHFTMHRYGRRDRKRTLVSVSHKAYTMHGFKCIGIYGRTARAKAMVFVGSDTPRNKGITLGKILPKLSEGRYIVMITGHALAVINGQVIDKMSNSSGQSVFAVYKLS